MCVVILLNYDFCDVTGIVYSASSADINRVVRILRSDATAKYNYLPLHTTVEKRTCYSVFETSMCSIKVKVRDTLDD